MGIISDKKQLIIECVILFLVSVTLVSIWFSHGHIISSGESGIPFYDFKHEAQNIGYVWGDAIVGNPRIISFPAYFFYQFLLIFSNLGFSGLMLQASFFFIIIFTSLVGMLLLTRETFSLEPYKRLVSPFFYLFNPFSLVVIWNRLQYPYFFLYALLPFALFLFIKGLKSNNYLLALLLGIYSFLFSFAFISLPSMELFWILLFLYLLYYSLLNFGRKKMVLKAILYFIFCFFIYLLLNMWWIAPYVLAMISTPHITNVAAAANDNLDVFKLLSGILGELPNLLRLIHRDFFVGIGKVWGQIYSSIPFLILSFSVPLLVFSSFFLKKKSSDFFFFFVLAVGGIFFAKGSAEPFGELFLFAFSKIRLLEVFRNPFEKIGFLLPLAFSPLFALSLVALSENISERFRKTNISLILGGLSLIFFGIYMFPMWNRWVFSSTFPPANNLEIGDYVEVPKYYSSANAWLKNDQDVFRVLAFPISTEGITYKWDYGYSGVELSNEIFEKPFISFSGPLQYLEDVTGNLERILIKSPNRFSDVMSILNVKYVMVRSDIDPKLSHTRESSYIAHLLNFYSGVLNLSTIGNFEKLTFYKSKETNLLSHIYPSDTFINYPQGGKSFLSLLPFSNYEKGDVFVGNLKGLSRVQDKTMDLKSIIPSKENAVNELPYVRYIPGDTFYPLILVKEKIRDVFQPSPEWTLTKSSKRLVEVHRLVKKGDVKRAEEGLKVYGQLMDELDGSNIFQNDIYAQDLFRHTYVLDEILSSSNNLSSATDRRQKLALLLQKLEEGGSFYENLYEKETLLLGQKVMLSNNPRSKENAVNELPYVRYIPGDTFYPLILVKEKIRDVFQPSPEWTLTKSSKRLVEVHRLVKKGDVKRAEEGLKVYGQLMDELDGSNIFQNDIYAQDLFRHTYVLDEILSSSNNLSSATDRRQKLALLLQKLGMEYVYKNIPDNYLVYKFSIPQDRVYELILENDNFQGFYQDKVIEYIIDGELKRSVTLDSKSNDVLALTSEQFKVGKHEIAFKPPVPLNLVNFPSESQTYLAKDDRNIVSFPIINYDPFTRYKFSFDYQLVKGQTPMAVLMQDIDPIEKGLLKPGIADVLGFDNYDFGIKRYENIITPNDKSVEGQVGFFIDPWNNCADSLLVTLKKQCLDKAYRKIFNKETIFTVRDMKLERVFDNKVFLRSKKAEIGTVGLPNIKFSKINPTNYEVEVINAAAPYLLVFSEGYHPEWSLTVEDFKGNFNKISENRHILVNSYANAWYIDKQGTYKAYLEYGSQSMYDQSKKAGIIIFVSISFFIISYVGLKNVGRLKT